MCSGTSQLGKELRTQIPNPQSERRCMFHSWNRGQGKHKRSEKRRGKEEIGASSV